MTQTIAQNQVSSPLLKERDYWFDNAKAILIVAVVVGHLANGTFSTSTAWVVALQKFIYVFHMPAFMIVSGRFAKRRIDKGDWVTVINRILVPYLVLQTLMLVLYSGMGYSSTSSFSYLKPLFGLWYFFNLGFYSLISPHLVKYKWLMPVSLLVGLGIGILPKVFYGGIYRIFAYYPFFLFGYYTHGMKFEFCKKAWFRVLSVAAFVITGLLVLKYNDNISFELLCMNKNYKFIAQDVGIRIREALLQNIIRYAVGFLFFFFILGVSPSKKTFFSYIGTNSSYVYALHIFIIVLLRSIDQKHDILRVLTNNWFLLAYCFSGIPMSFILASKPIRKLTRCFVEPNFDLRKLAQKLIKE